MGNYMNIEQLSDYLGGIPVNTLRQWCSRGKIPYIKVPGSNHVVFSSNDVDEWLSHGRRGGNGKSISTEKR